MDSVAPATKRKTMKILNVAALVAVAALAATGLSQGRPPMGGPGGPPGGMGMGGGRRPRSPQETADRQTQMMTQMLGLNAVQQKKVHDIVFRSAVQAQRLRDAQTAEINKLLTPDQKRKMASMRGPGGGMGRGGPGMGGPGMGRGGPGMGGPGGMRRGG